MKVMKKALMVAALGAAGLLSGNAQAVDVQDTFDVIINVTPVCTISTLVTDVTFAYDASAAGPFNSSGGNFEVTCTNGVGYTMALDQTNVLDATTNLAYTLGFSAAGPYSGTGSAQAYTVTGTMNGGQAAICPNVACDNSGSGNRTRTLTVSY